MPLTPVLVADAAAVAVAARALGALLRVPLSGGGVRQAQLARGGARRGVPGAARGAAVRARPQGPWPLAKLRQRILGE